METIYLLATALGLGFVAGINLYATVLTVGLGLRLGLIDLPPYLDGLAVLADPMVLVVASALYTVEFFADKVPWIDTAWDVIHTFVRPFGAVLLGLAAVGRVDPALEVVAVLLCGAVALSTHATKAGVRLVVNGSPEPLSNVGLSLAEDALVVGGTWLALAHPVLTGVGVAVPLAGLVMLVPRLLRALRALLATLLAASRRWRRAGARELGSPS